MTKSTDAAKALASIPSQRHALIDSRTYHGGASRHRSLGSDVEVVDRDGAHEGELHVGVRVDSAWNGVRVGCEATYASWLIMFGKR